MDCMIKQALFLFVGLAAKAKHLRRTSLVETAPSARCDAGSPELQQAWRSIPTESTRVFPASHHPHAVAELGASNFRWLNFFTKSAAVSTHRTSLIVQKQSYSLFVRSSYIAVQSY